MKFLYMKYFCDAVRLGSVTAAAKANFVTQSAVTQGIGKLENSLECALIARHPNRFMLTPEGHSAFLEMSDILKKTEKLHQTFAKDYTKSVGDLSFACTHSFALAIIPPLLKRFRTEHPSAKVSFYCSANHEEIKRMLKTREIDFGIAPHTNNFKGFEQRAIFCGTHKLYVSNEIALEDECNLEFILPEPDDTTYFKEEYFRKYGKYPAIFLEARSWEVIANLAIEGLGIGYFPDYIAEKKGRYLRQSHCE